MYGGGGGTGDLAVHTQGGAHKEQSVATAGVGLSTVPTAKAVHTDRVCTTLCVHRPLCGPPFVCTGLHDAP